MNKQYASGLGIAVVALIIGAVVMFKGPGDGTETALTPKMTLALGAAAQVPDDVAIYSSSLDLARQWQRVWESNAVQNLVALPTVQQLWMQAQKNPGFTGIMRTLETSPLAVQGLPVLRDALSTEVFVCAGPELPNVISAASELYGEIYFEQMRMKLMNRGPSADVNIASIIESLLAKEGELKVPSVLFGFRLTDVAAATKFLDTWIPGIGATPVGAIEKRAIQDGQFYVLDMSAEKIPNEVLQQMTLEFQRAKVSADPGPARTLGKLQ